MKLYLITVTRYSNVETDIDILVDGNLVKSAVPDALGFRFDYKNTGSRYTSNGNIAQGVVMTGKYEANLE